MIIYKGIHTKGKVYYASFSNESDNSVEIPIDETTAKRFYMYLAKIADYKSQIVENGNDEPSE